MRFLEVPWLEFSIATTLIGALWVSQIREPYRAARMGLVFTGIAFVFAFLAWLDYYVGIDTDSISLREPRALHLRPRGVRSG